MESQVPSNAEPLLLVALPPRRGPPSSLTSVLSWVVNVEVPVPHDCQLHRQVVDLHPFIGILPPGRG